MTHKEFINKYLCGIKWYIENDTLYVDSYLNLRMIKIKSLPENLYVHGWLDIRGTQITSLPKNLYIEGFLDMENLKITTLPITLHVEDFIDINNTKITSIPDDVAIRYIWHSKFITEKKIRCSEKMQLIFIENNEHALKRFKNPTEKSKAIHKLLWKI